MSPEFYKPVVVVTAFIALFVLRKSELPFRVIIATVGFGLSGALLFGVCYFLWAIGGIPFRVQANEWALGLVVLNMAVGLVVVRWLLGPQISPPARDIPPKDTPPMM